MVSTTPQNYTLESSITLTVDVWLSNDHVFTTGLSDITIDGDKHAVTFAKGDNSVIVLSAGLTFEDIVLRDFFPQALGVGVASLTFGNGTKIEMTDNNRLLSTDYTMYFDGYVEMNCFGNEFDISQVTNAMSINLGSTLCIGNARIKGLGGSLGSTYINNLRCLAPDSTLTLSNCELMLEQNYGFTEGYLNIYKDVVIRGPENPAGTAKKFTYQSPRPATIKSLGKLKIDRNVIFSYDSDSATKDKMVMEDSTSILHLNGCTLYSTHTGLKLDTGRLVVEDLVAIQNEASNSTEAMELGSNLEIDVLSGAIFDVVGGVVSYQ